MKSEQLPELTLLQVLVFYSIFMLSGWFVSSALRLAGLSSLYDLVVSTGLYGLLLIPIAYAFDPRVLSKPYWKFSKRIWVGVGVIALVQFGVESVFSLGPLDPYTKFAYLLAPSIEEFARAVTICPLMERLGGPAGLVITALIWTWPHDVFWVALVQQVILSLIFVYTNKSLPATIAGHTAMNIIAVLHIGLRTIVHH